MENPNTSARATALTIYPLTLIRQPIQTFVPSEGYTYSDAVNDALGFEEGPGTSLFIDSSHASDTLFLWESGCLMNGTNDCGLACSYSEEGLNMVWNSPNAMFTLHKCLVYPILATAAERGWLVQEQNDLLARFNISASNMLLTNASATYSRSPVPRYGTNRCTSGLVKYASPTLTRTNAAESIRCNIVCCLLLGA